MRIVRTQGQPFLGVVCCQHGHEIFGLDVFRRLELEASRYPGLIAVLANEEAMRAGKRFMETDLNRSYPGRDDGTHEERLAAQIVRELAGVKFVLDIHTTTCAVDLVPFVSTIEAAPGRIIGLTSAANVVAVGESLARQSLLGSANGAVSLEYGESFAAAHGPADVMRIVDGLYANRPALGLPRRVFTLQGTIPLGVEVPAMARDFVHCPELGGYPILLGEKSYVDKLGFLAGEPYVMTL